MRSVVAFYRARPVVGIVVFCIGLAIAVATASLRDGGGIILPILFIAVAGLVVGSVVGYGSRRRRLAAEEAFDFDAAEPDAAAEPPETPETRSV